MSNCLNGMAPRNIEYIFELVPRKNRSVACEFNGGNWIRSLRSKITLLVQIEEFISLWIRLQDFYLQPQVPNSITWKWSLDNVFIVNLAYKVQSIKSCSHIKSSLAMEGKG